MLPDMEGFEVARRLAAERADVPILFLTARDNTADKVRGLTIGGDDYVTKPFSLEELVARLRNDPAPQRARSSSRRAGSRSPTSSSTRTPARSSRAGRPIELTATEYRLLRYLMLNPRRVLTRAQLLDHVWSYDFGGDARVLETYISYLRKKLDVDGPPLAAHGARRRLRRCGCPGTERGVAARATAGRDGGAGRGRTDRGGGRHLRGAALVPAHARRPAGAVGAWCRSRPARLRRSRSLGRSPRRQPAAGVRGPGGRAAQRRPRRSCRRARSASCSAPSGKDQRRGTFSYGGDAGAAPDAARAVPGQPQRASPHLFTVSSPATAGPSYRAVAFERRRPDTAIVAVPLREVDQTLHRLVVVEVLVGAGVILALVAARLAW